MAATNHSTPHKNCTRCKRLLPETSEYFAPAKGYKNGLNSMCRDCIREARKARSNQPVPPGTERTCKTCNQPYPLTDEFWHKDSGDKYGFSYSCKECAKGRARDWVEDNPERNKENCKTRYSEKRDEYIAYRERNAEHIAEMKRDWRKRNPDKVKKHKSESQKRNRPSARARGKRWRENHPEESRALTMQHIARKKNALGKYTGDDIKRMYDEQEGQCIYCGIRLYLDIPKDVHVDHIIPLSKGGTNYPENLYLACGECNQSKNNHDLAEWLAMRGW